MISTHTEPFAAEHATIAVNPRGFGDSSPAPPLFTPRKMARDVVSIMKALHLERAHLFGISLGAVIAAWVAIDAGDRVDRLVLASAITRRPALSVRRLVEFQRLARCFSRSDAKQCLAENIVAPGTGANRREISENVAKVRPRSRAALIRFATAAMLGAPRKDALLRIRAPTMVLLGGQDPILSVKTLTPLVDRIGRLEVHVIPNAGHDLVAEAPDVTAEHVLGFLHADDAQPRRRNEQAQERSGSGSGRQAKR